VHVRSRSIPRRTTVERKHRATRASEHKCCAQPGRAGSDDGNINSGRNRFVSSHDRSVDKINIARQHGLPKPGQRAREVAESLRTHRHATGWTLRDVAERTGIPRSTLSRLETGARRPTVELLIPLADLYGVSVDGLVERTNIDTHMMGHRGQPWTVLPLSTEETGAVTSKIVLRPTGTEPVQVTHPGSDWLMVLSGRLRLLLAGTETELLPHHTATFATTTPHWFGVWPGEVAEIVSLFSRSETRPHARVLAGDQHAHPAAQPH
jgi:transcriptional regulator with XRE-family HTH domain